MDNKPFSRDHENDLISRQQAIEEAKEWIEAVYCDHDEIRERMAIKHVINGIKKLPPAQPDKYWKEQCQSYERTINKLRESLSKQPEIIRCSDCRYYNSEEKECLDLLGHGRRWEEDDFCSYAER